MLLLYGLHSVLYAEKIHIIQAHRFKGLGHLLAVIQYVNGIWMGA